MSQGSGNHDAAPDSTAGRNSAVFDLLRWILEGGFSGHRTVFANELRSACVHERAAVE